MIHYTIYPANKPSVCGTLYITIMESLSAYFSFHHQTMSHIVTYNKKKQRHINGKTFNTCPHVPQQNWVLFSALD